VTSQHYTSPTAPPSTTRHSTHRTAAQIAALVTGIAFLLVGVAGFIPGITENVDQLEFAGHESDAELLGVFEVSILHNIVHLLFGVIGLAAAARYAASRMFLIVGGLVYLALWVYGLAIDHDTDANFVPLNDADNWLHLGLGAAMVLLGLLLTDRHRGDWDSDASRRRLDG
jgi:hypothetical protein